MLSWEFKVRDWVLDVYGAVENTSSFHVSSKKNCPMWRRDPE